MANSNKLAYTAAQVLAIRTVTGNKVGENLLNVPLEVIPNKIESISGGGEPIILTGNAAINDVRSGKTFYNTDANTKLTGTLIVDEPLPEWWEVEAPIELMSGTLHGGVAPDGTAFFSTSTSTSGLWKLNKTTRTFTRIRETGVYNTFQTVGNHTLIITSTLSSGTGIITHYNGTTRVAYETGYNWLTRKIVADHVAFLGTTSASYGVGLLRVKQGLVSIEVSTGNSWAFQDFDGHTFMWTNDSTTLGVYKYDYSELWEPEPAVQKVWEYNYAWSVYIDEETNLFMLGAGVSTNGGIIIWETNQFVWRYSNPVAYNVTNTYKYSNTVYFMAGGSPLRFNRSTNSIYPMTGTTGFETLTLLPNGYLAMSSLNYYNGVAFHNIATEKTTVYYSGIPSGGGKVHLLEDGVVCFLQYSTIVSNMRMWFFDYATMTQTDLVATYGYTLTTGHNLINSIAIKNKVIIVNSDTTVGTLVYNNATKTLTKIATYNSTNSSNFVIKQFDVTNTDDFIIRDGTWVDVLQTNVNGYSRLYFGVKHYNYSTDSITEIVPPGTSGVEYLYVENIFSNGYFCAGNVSSGITSPRVYNRITKTVTLLSNYYLASPPSDANTSSLYINNPNSIYWALTSAGTGYYGIYKINKSDASATKIYNSTSNSINYFKYTTPNAVYVMPNTSTMLKLIIDSEDNVYELNYAGQIGSSQLYTNFIMYSNNKLYISSTSNSNRYLYYLDFDTKQYMLETTLGWGYTSGLRRDYQDKTYFLAPGYTYNFTDKVPVKFNNGANSITPYALGQYHFLEASTVSDFKTRQSKTFTDYYSITPTVSNNVAVARGEYGYILYGEVD